MSREKTTKPKTTKTIWSPMVNPIHHPVFVDFQNKNHSIYFLLGGRGAGKSELMYLMIEALLRGDTGHSCKILVIRTTKDSAGKSIFSKVYDIITKNLKINLDDKKSFVKQSRERGELIVNYNGLRHTIILESFFASKDTAEKLKGYSQVSHIFVDELKENPTSEMFDQLLTTIKRGYIDPQTGIFVKPIAVCSSNVPEKNHWLRKDWYDLEPSQIDGFFKLIPKTGNIEGQDLTYEDIGVMHSFSTIYDNYLFKDNVIKYGGEKEWKQTLYLGYERYKTTDLYKYYTETLGLVASGRSGRIFTDWKKISYDEWQQITGDLFYGVDFGYANDETTVTAIKYIPRTEEENRDKLYIHNIIYEKKLLTSALASKIVNLIPSYKSVDIYTDQKPEAVAELKDYNINVKSAKKGNGSRVVQVNFLSQFEVFYTNESNYRQPDGQWKGLDNEIENYFWLETKSGGTEPSDGNDHILDGIRYAVFNRLHRNNQSIFDKFWFKKPNILTK